MADQSRDAKDARALELRRAGVPTDRIRTELGLRSAKAVDEAVVRAMAARGLVVDPVRVRDMELDRLDRIHQAVWVKAVKGDLPAVDRVLKIGEARVRYAGAAEVGTSRMVQAFESTVESLVTVDADAALIAAGRRIAEKIDAAAAGTDPVAETKSLYLVPHLMNVLRELGATPAARAAAVAPPPDDDEGAGDAGEGPVGLEEWKRRARGGAGSAG